METKGTFHEAEIDYGKEYCTARELMGTIGTDLDLLFRSVGLLYLNCPEDVRYQYQALLDEITMRKDLLRIDFRQEIRTE